MSALHTSCVPNAYAQKTQCHQRSDASLPLKALYHGSYVIINILYLPQIKMSVSRFYELFQICFTDVVLSLFVRYKVSIAGKNNKLTYLRRPVRM